MAASHTATFAERFGRQARDTVVEHGRFLGATLDAATTAAANWRLENRSEYFAVGVGGTLSGRRADLGLIDDPLNEGQSEKDRENVWQWYQDVFLTRLKPEGRIVIIMTRWHQDDLMGRLLETQPKRWRVLRVPAIADMEADPLGREIGEPLWHDDPSYPYGAELETKRAEYEEAGSMRTWSALYQQNPIPEAGGLFTAPLRVVDALPEGVRWVRAWDLAGTAKQAGRDPDWTVDVKLGRVGSRTIVGDVVRRRGGPHEVEQWITETARLDEPSVRIRLPQDPGQAGKAQVAYLIGKLAGFTAESSPETGDKRTRAEPFAAQVNAGNVEMLRAPWNLAYGNELRDFPNGAKDDQVDASSRAFAMFVTGPNFDSSYGWVA